jgi:hypothetical protein
MKMTKSTEKKILMSEQPEEVVMSDKLSALTSKRHDTTRDKMVVATSDCSRRYQAGSSKVRGQDHGL